MPISLRPALRVVALLILGLLLSTSSVAATMPIRGSASISDPPVPTPTPTIMTTPSPAPQVMSASAVDPAAEPVANTTTRPKPSPRPYSNPAGQPAPTATSTPSASGTPDASPTATTPAGPPRLDDSVLRWLPEIITAAGATGVPPELIAAIMRVESQGNPNIISPAGARGLMQIMPDELSAQGISFDARHDPATNIMAGAVILLQRSGSGWDGAAASYFGSGCDVFGTCTETYVSVVLGWMAYYAPIIANPYSSGFAILGPDWSPPAIEPFVEAAPPTPEPPPTVTPEPTATPTPAVEPTATPTDEPPAPTEAPTTEPTAVPPTEVPPTEIPPTEAPPTEPPTEVPTEEPPPTEAPPADSGQPGDAAPTEDASGG
jgi:hypothetical protein